MRWNEGCGGLDGSMGQRRGSLRDGTGRIRMNLGRPRSLVMNRLSQSVSLVQCTVIVHPTSLC